MTHSSQPPSLRIRTVDDLVAVIPRLLGFQPHESLTLVVIDGGRLEVTARLDLTACTPSCLDEQVGPLWLRYPGAAFLVVAYSQDPDAAWAALDAFARVAPPTLDVSLFHADGRRWFDAPDGAGRPYDVATSTAVAQAAVAGLAVLPDREALEASLDVRATPRQVRRALRAVERRGLDHDGLIREALRLVALADAGAADEVGVVEASVLALASFDLAFREAAILSTSRANADRRVEVWRRVVQQCVPSCSGYALVLLGLAAWVAGQGALQVMCIERAGDLATDRDWLDFLDQTNRLVLHPDQWEQLRADWYCEHLAPVTASPDAEAG